MSVVPEMSRDAYVIWTSLFLMGPPASVTFHTPSRILPRTLAALEELTGLGMIAPTDPNSLPRGSRGWKATDQIGEPWKQPRPDESEFFPMLKQDDA